MLLNSFNLLFPLWAIAVSVWAYLQPAVFNSYGGWIVPLLSLVMFLMGLTLGIADFKRIARSPRPVFIGVALQFLLMPLLAWLIAGALQLPEPVAVGLILVGCCAGGTASNVICYLARGNVALSITMTLVSTLVGVALTPLLSSIYLAQSVEVDRLSMFLGIGQMVLLPVLAGVLVNHFLARRIAPLQPLFASLAIVSIVLIIAIIVGLNQASLASIGLITLIAVILHNSLGLVCGYGCSRLLRLGVVDSRTVAIEVGMQNSGLGVALAMKYFSAGAALPGAVFSVWHNLSGSALASYWGSSNMLASPADDSGEVSR